MLSTTNKVSGL